ncbi:replication initiation negative regulator SeqA [Alteromonas pelagimontana]|uniref:Negative modulator of initiation of replication n=1 Tax=Alteromonas pelagimontana TaxID=1858656 RepID=A0A6M4MA37_9ALTE|nr:replication initiation negative regulator SeqA [Alteromonas pelagimontana]QJR79678.1 replication initiation negative regulator SeqA [Alteromonas pelagimontana]
MKRIDIDEDLYGFIASQTKHIGESASDILRRLLMPETPAPAKKVQNSGAVGSARTDIPATPAKTSQAKKPSAPPPSDEAAPSVVHGKGDILARLTDKALAAYTKRVDQFVFILSELHHLHPDAFAKVEQIKGKNRTYFATSKEELLENGSSTNPKAIPDSPYWVVTNNNTAKKVAMLEHVLQILGYDEDITRAVVAKFD